ncbi:MAG: hypothetical protein ACPL88_08960, partial [Bryobacteraceae bacterium]
ALERSLGAWECVVRHRIHRGVFENVIFGVLKSYDLPDLAATLAPRKLWLIDAVNQLGQPMRPDEVHGLYAAALKAGNTRILRRQPEQPIAVAYRDFVETW